MLIEYGDDGIFDTSYQCIIKYKKNEIAGTVLFIKDHYKIWKILDKKYNNKHYIDVNDKIIGEYNSLSDVYIDIPELILL